MVHPNDYIPSWDAEKLNDMVEKANSHLGKERFKVENEDDESGFIKLYVDGEEEQRTFDDFASVYSFFCGVSVTMDMTLGWKEVEL